MTQSIELNADPAVSYLLRLGDTCLIHAQRIAQWCGHAPITEEDIALSNMALDLLGQARGLLSHAALVEGRGHDEDQLAFLRNERDYLNATLVELPNGNGAERDFALTVLRNTLMATWLKLLWERLQDSSDAQVAGIAAKALKEARYHQQHSADWLVRLGDGTDESMSRVRLALATLWPYTRELFDADEVDEHAASTGLGPRWEELREPWLAEIAVIFAEAQLELPSDPKFRSEGRRGRHSEHMGYVLAELQYLQRAFPGGAW